jgi:hypothetical protein
MAVEGCNRDVHHERVRTSECLSSAKLWTLWQQCNSLKARACMYTNTQSMHTNLHIELAGCNVEVKDAIGCLLDKRHEFLRQ